MKRLMVIGLVLGGLLVPVAEAAYKEGSTRIVVEDGEADRPYKRWIYKAKVPTPAMTLTVVEGTDSRPFCGVESLGCANGRGSIFLTGPAASRFTFRHEVGHFFAWRHLGPSRIAYFKRLLRTEIAWNPDPTGYSPPQEAFADIYAFCARGLRRMLWSADIFRMPTQNYRRACRMIHRARAGVGALKPAEHDHM